MQTNKENIAALAQYDPVTAYGLAHHYRRAPFTASLEATFSTFALGAAAMEVSLETQIEQRTFIRNMTYSLSLPNVFKGNLLKPQFDKDMKAHPGVDVRLIVFGCARYVESPEFTPLENLAPSYDACWPEGWVIQRFETITGEFILTEAPSSTEPNAPPYVVTLTFNGWSFLGCELEGLRVCDASDALRKMGYWVPDLPECPSPQPLGLGRGGRGGMMAR